MMKRWNKPLLALALVGALAVGQIGLAQEAVDPAALADVAVAFESTRSVESLHLMSQSLTESSGGANGFDLSLQLTQEFDLARTESGWNASGSLVTSSTLPMIGAIELTSEIISIDGVTYARFTDLPEGLPLELPQDWVDMEQFTAEQGGLPFGPSDNQLLAMLLLPLDEQSVTAITALPADTIDDQAMSVYQITLDPAAVLESEAASLLNVGLGAGLGGLPGGGNGPLPQRPAVDQTPPAPEDIQMTFAVYIGDDDGLVHRLYTVIQIAPSGEGDAARPGLQTTTVTDLSRFDEPVEITAPEPVS